MALSKYTVLGDGVKTQFAVTFTLGYISKTDVQVRVNDEIDGGGDPLYRTLTWITDELVDVGAAPGVGETVVFTRTVANNAPIHDFVDGAQVIEQNLDENQKQAIMLAHEAQDGRFTTAAEDNRDMGGNRIINLGDPVDDADAIAKAWAIANLGGDVSPAVLDAAIAVHAALTASHGVVGNIVGDTDIAVLTNKTLNDVTNLIHADAVHLKSRNVSGGPFVRGQVVYESAYNSGQDAIEILLADADNAAAMPALGIVDEGILNNANGSILKVGMITGDATDALDTTGGGEVWAVGDALYVSSTAGTLTNVKPTGKSELIQSIATVLRVHASLGSIFVDGAGRANALPNSGVAEHGFAGKSYPKALVAETALLIKDGNLQHGTLALDNVNFNAPTDADEGYIEYEMTIDAVGAYTINMVGFTGQITGAVDTTALAVNTLKITKRASAIDLIIEQKVVA
jgi:hypothetical protein